jgi:hypothetical protein
MDKEPEIDIKVDDDMRGIAVIRCPNCNTVARHPMTSLSDGSEIECSCGFVIRLNGDEFSSLQRDLEDLKRLLDDF